MADHVDAVETVTECPVCCSVILLKYINDHIDACLQKRVKSNVASTSTQLYTEKKKQSVLYFSNSSESPPHSRGEGSLPPLKIRKKNQDNSITSINAPQFSDSSCHVPPESPVTKYKAEKNTDRDTVACTLKAPLAELVRPTSFDGFVGQEKLTGQESFLHSILKSGDIPSLIFWGPPGCGKTTLARIIANSARKITGANFIQFSATTSGIADVKEAVKTAKNRTSLLKRKTLLFIDEIHRFNKLQQDSFLPHVEDGTITLLGATTENPSFQLNSALLSRCRVIVLDKLQSADIKILLERALKTLDSDVLKEKCCLESSKIWVRDEAITALANLCDGDARSALNGLQLAVQIKRTQQNQCLQKKHLTSIDPDDKSKPACDGGGSSGSGGGGNDTLPCDVDKLSIVTVKDIKTCLQKTHLLYDRVGEEHYNCISALHKSMRGSDANASLYWLARMLCAGEDPIYVARRVIRFASEDIGLADTNALPLAVAAFNACQYIGMPECEVNLAQAVVYMARAPKSIEVYGAYNKAKACVKEHDGPLPSVPLHLRNAPTKLMKNLGYGHGYIYNPDFIDQSIDQTYMPDELSNMDFFGQTT